MTWLIRLYCYSRGQRSRNKGKRRWFVTRLHAYCVDIHINVHQFFFSIHSQMKNADSWITWNDSWRMVICNRFICKLLTARIRQKRSTISRFTSRRISRTGWTAFVACPSYLTRERGDCLRFALALITACLVHACLDTSSSGMPAVTSNVSLNRCSRSWVTGDVVISRCRSAYTYACTVTCHRKKILRFLTYSRLL